MDIIFVCPLIASTADIVARSGFIGEPMSVIYVSLFLSGQYRWQLNMPRSGLDGLLDHRPFLITLALHIHPAVGC